MLLKLTTLMNKIYSDLYFIFLFNVNKSLLNLIHKINKIEIFSDCDDDLLLRFCS